MNEDKLEDVLLGKIMLEPDVLNKYFNAIHIDLFEYPFNRDIFHLMLEYKESGKLIDVISLTRGIRKKYPENTAYLLSSIMTCGQLLSNVTSCISSLQLNYQKRKLLNLSFKIENMIKNRDEIEDIREFIFTEVSKISNVSTEKLPELTTQLDETLDLIETKMNTKGLLGIATGFNSLDNFTGGWQPTDLVIIGAATSMGKTAFAVTLLLNACKYSNTPSVIFSYEMSVTQILQRLYSMESGIDNEYIRKGTLNVEEFKKIHDARTVLGKLPLHIDECYVTSLDYLMRKIKSYVKKKSVKLVLVDYLQLVSVDGNKREQEVSKVARSLKNLAKELDITIIALSQLNRSVDYREQNGNIPKLSDLRESGEIEQAADVIMLIHRPEYYKQQYTASGESTKGLATIIIAKGRNIGVGEIKLGFKHTLTKFINHEEI